MASQPNSKLWRGLTRRKALKHEKSLFAWPVCYSAWLDGPYHSRVHNFNGTQDIHDTSNLSVEKARTEALAEADALAAVQEADMRPAVKRASQPFGGIDPAGQVVGPATCAKPRIINLPPVERGCVLKMAALQIARLDLIDIEFIEARRIRNPHPERLDDIIQKTRRSMPFPDVRQDFRDRLGRDRDHQLSPSPNTRLSRGEALNHEKPLVSGPVGSSFLCGIRLMVQREQKPRKFLFPLVAASVDPMEVERWGRTSANLAAVTLFNGQTAFPLWEHTIEVNK